MLKTFSFKIVKNSESHFFNIFLVTQVIFDFYKRNIPLKRNENLCSFYSGLPNKHDGPNNRDGRKFQKDFMYFFGRKLKISQLIFQYSVVC